MILSQILKYSTAQRKHVIEGQTSVLLLGRESICLCISRSSRQSICQSVRWANNGKQLVYPSVSSRADNQIVSASD